MSSSSSAPCSTDLSSYKDLVDEHRSALRESGALSGLQKYLGEKKNLDKICASVKNTLSSRWRRNTAEDALPDLDDLKVELERELQGLYRRADQTVALRIEKVLRIRPPQEQQRDEFRP